MKPMITLCIWICCLSMLIGTTPAASQEGSRWMNHSDIKAIRAIHREVERSIDKGILKKTQAPAHCFREQSALTEAYLATDGEGIIRKLFIAYGTEDSVGSMAYYYDPDGALRFTFQSVGAVNGTRQERRIYFDKTGKELHSDDRILAGPGYNFVMERYVPQPGAYLESLCE
jgi:hypothetical protein